MSILEVIQDLFRPKKTKITIETTENGAVLHIKGHFDYNEGYPAAFCYSWDTEGSKEGMQELLWELVNALDSSAGKYSRERIYIQRVHGENVTCTDKACEICTEEEHD